MTRKKAAARKTKVARKKAATKKPPARKSGAKQAAARKKRSGKSVKKAARRPAKGRGASQSARKTPRKSTARSTTRPSPVAVAPGLPAEPPSRTRRPAKLTKKDLDQFRDLLRAKRAQLVGDVSTLQKQALSENRQDAAGDLSSMPIHMADLGTDNYEKEFTLGLIESERTLLREIDAALGRIEDGTYGICEATGKPIGKTRLKAQPWVRYCYEYVLAQERGRQSSGL
jgi:RNA polymerase-binding protein DksA